MDEHVSPKALDCVLDVMKVLLSTDLLLLAFSVTFMEKVLGSARRRAVSLVWVAWGLLLAAIPLIVICMFQTITVAQTMGQDVVTVGADPSTLASRLATETLDSWHWLGRYAALALSTWVLGVLLLAAFILIQRPVSERQSCQPQDNRLSMGEHASDPAAGAAKALRR